MTVPIDRRVSGWLRGRPGRSRILAVVMVVAVGAASAALFIGGSKDAQTPSPLKRPRASPPSSAPHSPGHRVLFGAWVRPVGGWDPAADERGISQLQLQLGRKLALDEVYVTWTGPMPLSLVRWNRRQGTETMISWAGTNAAALAAGVYDGEIRARAIQLRDLHQPVMLRWFPEMDGVANRPNALSPATFIAAWRHMHDIFDGAGATNVLWVWCPTAAGFSTGVAQEFYPGPGYVNWVGSDGYNWAPELPHAAWVSFGQIFAGFYQWGLKSGKPMLVGEYGVLEAQPGQKAAWFAQAEHQIQAEFPGIRAVVYFDSDHDGFNWEVTTSSSALAAFRAFALDPYFGARPFASES